MKLGFIDLGSMGAAIAANLARVSMPVLGVMQEHLRQTIAREGAGIDWSGIAKTIEHNCGS